jgi:hypothetical protein
METPTPIDLNKLKNILGNAKKVMKATDDKFGSKLVNKNQTIQETYSSNENIYTTPIYDENDEKEPNYGVNYENYTTSPQIHNQRNYTMEDVVNSKLPPIIKEAMIKKPIPKIQGLPSKFTLNDMEDLIEPPKTTKQHKKIITESNNSEISDTITITIDKLNELIDKRVNEVVARMFVKTLTEQTIKKTISSLLKEGKLLTKKLL